MTTNPAAKVLNWLRAGYPEGIPQEDHVALFGVLHRNLTAEEVERVAQELRDGEGGLDSSVTDEQIGAHLKRATLQQPTADEINRVHARLAYGGWPLVPGAELGETGKD